MKKAAALLLLLAMALSMLVGCEPAPAPETPDTTQTPDTPVTPDVPETPAEPEAPAELVVPQWTEPVYNVEETLENRQKALSATALAYFYKGILNQYGLQDLNVIDEAVGGNLRGRTLERNTPEENTEDLTLYQWCSSYVYDIVYHTMGYRIADDYRYCRTANLSAGSIGDSSIVAHQYNLTGNEAKDKEVIDKIIADFQPGDIVNWTRPEDGAGHSLILINDVTGDGEMDVLHRTGSRYDMATGADKTETHGIKRESLNTFYEEFNCLYTKTRISVVRVTNLDPAKYPLTQSAKARLAWPGLRIDRTVSGGTLASVESGGELTYTITISSNADQAIKGMPVMDKLDSHCTMVSQDGKPATTTFPVWTVDIEPFGSVTLTYTVKVEGNPGEKIVSEGGSVAGIPSNQLTTTIQAFTPDAARLQAEQDAVAAAAKDGLEFVNKLYEAATGVNPGILSTEETLAAMFDSQTKVNRTLYTLKEGLTSAPGNMLIPTYLGGRYVLTGDNDRILDTRLDDLKAGDILVVAGKKQNNPIPYYWIFNGEKLVEWSGGKVKNVSEKNLIKVLSYDWFVCLRPSLALTK